MRPLPFVAALFSIWALAAPLRAQNLRPTYDLSKLPGSAEDAVDHIIYGAGGGHVFGACLVSADISGDGIADLIAASPYADPVAPARPNAGVVNVWFGPMTLGGTQDLQTTPPDLRIIGAAGDQLARNATPGGVSDIATGDVNGDDLTDLILLGPAATSPGSGKAYVIFGRASFPAMLDMAVSGVGGADVIIYGAPRRGINSVVVGDITGDGMDDLILDNGSYVVFGRAAWPPSIALAVGDGLYLRIYGGAAPSGRFVQTPKLGDFNGDGVKDMLLTNTQGDGPGNSRGFCGEVYLILGRRSPAEFPANMHMEFPGAGGADVTIFGATADDRLSATGENPSSAVGDVNGDGIDDIVLGAELADGPGNSRTDAGEVYFVFGRASFPTTLDLSVQGAVGASVTLYGRAAGEALGAARFIATADVNGDSVSDMIVASRQGTSSPEVFPYAGVAYIVFGRAGAATFPRTLDLALQGAAGADVTVYGVYSVAAGDVNGDGIADLALGSSLESSFRGKIHFVTGRRSPVQFPATMDMRVEGLEGASVTLTGADVNDHLASYQEAHNPAWLFADLDNNGIRDFIVSGRHANGPGNTRPGAGEIYFLRGSGGPEIVIEHPAATELAAGTSRVFYGAVTPGQSSAPRTFTVKNTGSLPLKISSVALTGGQSGDFDVDTTGMLASVPGGGQTMFSVTFTPASAAPRITTLRITSDDLDESQYDILLAGNVAPEVRPLVMNQQFLGLIETPVSEDHWTFTAEAFRQVRFDLLNASGPGVEFALRGPNGFIGFEDLVDDSGLIVLPEAGTYTLYAVGDGTAENLSYSFRMEETTVTDIYLASPTTGNLYGSRQAELYRLDLTTAGPLSFSLANSGAGNRVEMYVRRGIPPTRRYSEYQEASGPGANRNVFIAHAEAGLWYVLVYADTVATPGTFTIEPASSAVMLADITSRVNAVNAPARLVITGAGFQPGSIVELLDAGNVIATATTTVDSLAQITAIVPANIGPIGLYDVQVRRPDGAFAVMTGAFQSIAGSPRLETQFITPPALGRHEVATLYVEYANTGTVPMSAPVLIVKSADADGSDRPILSLDASTITQLFWSEHVAYPPGTASEVLILASGAQPGILGAGERRRVPVYFLGLLKPYHFSDSTTELELRYWTADDTTPMDWPARKAALRPPTMNPLVWDIVFDRATAGLGSNAAYVEMLSENARYLAGLGQHVTDVGELWNFELMQAYGLSPVPVLDAVTDASMPAPGTPLALSRRFSNSLRSRWDVGPFGSGWFTTWQTRLVMENNGDVVKILGEGGSTRAFTRDTRDPLGNRHFSSPGDTSRLVKDASDYELRSPDGVVTRFMGGRIAWVQDSNGNRVTTTYDGLGRLAALAHSAGGKITLSYNTAGLVSLVSDSAGRRVTYAYTGMFLDSATTDDGKVTRYTYDLAGAPAVQRALTSITRSGVTRSFTWDAAGRLASIFTGAAEEITTFVYDSTGGVSVKRGAGIEQLCYDHRGLIAKTVDALGNVTTSKFDDLGRLSLLTLPTGETRRFAWDARNNPTRITDERGRETHFTYNHPLARLTHLVDANGSPTTYAYDVNGNLTGTTYTDNSIEKLSAHTGAGLPQTRVNRRGQTVTYTYTANGQMDRRTLADGSYADFDYDARGNLTTVTEHPATGANKVTRYLFNHATQGDRLKKITNPNGSWIEYFHDAHGRRTRMTDSTGGDTRYEFDTAGRLSKVRNAANAVLAEYLYEAAGRMQRVNKGNGTYTTYAYDLAGQLIHLVNFAPDDTPQSQFDYTYDARGRRTAMATLDGNWTYGYDATGQLISATFSSFNINIPNRLLNYEYDALGNRTTASVDFVPTAYTSDYLNQYSDIGGAAQTYDADGNLTNDGTRTYIYDTLNQLTQVTGPEGVTQYEYDALGNRTATILNGQRTDYLLDVTGTVDVVAEVPAIGATQRLVHGAGLISRGAAGAARYFDYDGIGSTAALTDATGVEVNEYVYEPFGSTMFAVEAAPNPFQFIGQLGVQKEASGLHFMRLRFYSAASGRFTQPDPIGLLGADMNVQRYAHNNPVSFNDPLGTFSSSDFLDAAQKIKDFKTEGSDYSVGEGVADLLTANQVITVVQGLILLSEGSTLSNPYGFAWALGGLIGKGLLEVFPELGTMFGDLVFDLLNPDQARRNPRSPGGPHPSGPGRPGGNGRPNNPQSLDPNEKLGPGVGAPGWIAPGALAPYRINFENLGPGSRDGNGNPFPTFATAPAHRVTITDQLDPNLDWNTFELTSFGFGDTIIPAGNRSHCTTTVPMTYNGETFDVEIEAGIDFPTGRMYVAFQSINPATSLPPNVLTGFLPPEDGTGIGKGHVSYVVRAKGLPHGAEIRNVAEIRFDINDVITTDQIDPLNPAAGTDPAKQALSTVDAVAPVSSVLALAPALAPDFTVSWSGTDTGNGIAAYDVYVSEDGGAWRLWQNGTSDTSAIYRGRLGHTYAFYSVALDFAGNVQPTPGGAQTSTSTALVNKPVLGIVPGSTPEKFFIEISARPGQVVTLQHSADLVVWSDLQEVTISTGTATVEINTVAPPVKRFFRARWTPTP